jgi:predicted lactoylglutathione lyase
MITTRIHMIAIAVANIQRSLHFYQQGLGFQAEPNDENPNVIFFNNEGSILELYEKTNPLKPNEPLGHGFDGIILSQNVQNKNDIDTILLSAEKAGGTIIKPMTATSWGGYHGYFSDPDHHYWVVAYWENWKYREDGSLIINIG